MRKTKDNPYNFNQDKELKIINMLYMNMYENKGRLRKFLISIYLLRNGSVIMYLKNMKMSH